MPRNLAFGPKERSERAFLSVMAKVKAFAADLVQICNVQAIAKPRRMPFTKISMPLLFSAKERVYKSQNLRFKYISLGLIRSLIVHNVLTRNKSLIQDLAAEVSFLEGKPKRNDNPM